MTDRMLEDVVRFTNIKIGLLRNTIGRNNRRKSTYAYIDVMDLKAVIGMLILSGSKKGQPCANTGHVLYLVWQTILQGNLFTEEI